MGGPEIDAMYGDDDVQGQGAVQPPRTFKRGTGADQALRARTRNHNRLAHIFGCLVQNLHFIVYFQLVTFEAHVEQTDLVRIARDC